jgi:DNA-binding Lrp family transcriptional regulator
MPSAFILINCDFKSISEVIGELRKIPHVIQVHPVEGVYDIITKINASTEEDLRKIVLRIRYFDNVISTLTMIISKESQVTTSTPKLK